jgi:hypothetical protein
MLDPALINLIITGGVSVLTAAITASVAKSKINQRIAALEAENTALARQREEDRAEFAAQMAKMEAGMLR